VTWGGPRQLPDSVNGVLYAPAFGAWNGTTPPQTIMQTTDGVNWTTAKTSPEYYQRQMCGFVYLNGYYIIFGGCTSSSVLYVAEHFTYTATDPANIWTKSPSGTKPASRYNHGYCVHNGYIFIVGGTGSSGALSDIVRSSDGHSWTTVAAGTPYPASAAVCLNTLLSFKGRLWTIGGQNYAGTTFYPHVYYSSDDGVTWTTATTTAPWGSYPSLMCGWADDHHMYLAGGYNGSLTPKYSAALWRSSDGITWENVNPKLAGTTSGMAFHSVGKLRGRILLFGSNNTSSAAYLKSAYSWR